MNAPLEVRPAGDLGVLVLAPDAATRRVLDAALRAAPPEGLVDQVPAGTSVLLRFDSAGAASSAAARLARDGVPTSDAAAVGDHDELVVPTVYDGEDLAEVAGHVGMTAAELVAWHTSRTFTVDFGGFLPGFGYLVCDEALDVPRRSSPRTRVPAGSVALAGPWTAVYPQASPGGWQLIGRTDLAAWDVYRDPPALFTPGRRVRFEQVERVAEPVPGAVPEPVATPALTVLRPGPLALVEDLGRPGHGALGVPTGGAADRRAHRLANRLVGNPEDAATIESLLGGLQLRVEREVVVALTGAPADARVDVLGEARAVPWATPLVLGPGSVLTLGTPQQGLRSYVGVRGGVRLGSSLFGSFAGDPTTGLGPGPLRAGSALALGPEPDADPVATALATSAHRWGDVTLRLVPGPADDWFTDAGLATLFTTPWQVSAQADRVGVRLTAPDGRTIERAVGGERASEGMVRGAVQVPASGEPIVFLADHPTTGGYPVIGCVVDADTDALAQCRPGDTVRFTRAR